MTLEISDLERAERRDNSSQRQAAKSVLDNNLYWFELFGEEEKAIKYGRLFQGIQSDDEHEIYQKWEVYLSENLAFPIETKVVETERGRIRDGAKVKLLGIDDYDEHYGIFGNGKYGREAVTFPICNLEAVNQKSKNYDLLRDYAIWFANR